MWNKIYILLIVISIQTPLFAQELSDVSLKWEEVEGALGYVLEVRDSEGKVIINERIRTNYYELKGVSPGNIEHRVGVINKFGKVEGFTKWVPIEIVKTREPIILDTIVYSAGMDESTKRIEIKGNHFLENMKVYVLKDGVKTFATNVEISKNGTVAYATFAIEKFPEIGQYDLILENPRKKTAIKQKSFILGKDKEQAEVIANRQARINRNELPPGYYDTPYWSTMWRSTVFPGWGQNYIDDNSWKLYIYPIVLAGSFAVYNKSTRDFFAARSDYYNSLQLSFLLSSQSDSELLILLNNQTTNARFNRAKVSLNYIKVGMGAVSVFAIYNLVDAFFSVRRNVVIQDEKGLDLGNSWKLRASSEIRPTSNWEMGSTESYSNFEFYLRY